MEKGKDIFIDVTGSAPSFSVPGKQLEGTFDILLKGMDPSKTKILDFGGAKLRNTLHLLKRDLWFMHENLKTFSNVQSKQMIS